MGRAGLINSGGASGANDFEEAVATAVINKRAGAPASSPAEKPSSAEKEGVQLLNTIQTYTLVPKYHRLAPSSALVWARTIVPLLAQLHGIEVIPAKNQDRLEEVVVFTAIA